MLTEEEKTVKELEDFYKNDTRTDKEITTDSLNKAKKNYLDSLPVDVYQDNKINSAEQFYIKQPFFYDETCLFWFWNNDNSCYELIDEITLMNGLRRKANNAVIIKSKEWGEIQRAMKLVGRDHIPKKTEKTWIQFKDIIMCWKTHKKVEISPKHWNTNPIPWNCKEGYTPTINRLFEEWVGSEYVQTLKEIIAYCMIQDYPLHRIFCLTGSGLNGKGVFQMLLKKVIGEKNVASSELDDLIDNRFGSAKLYKKLVCQMGETNFSEISKTSMLKKLSGQDLVGMEFKNKNPFDTVNYAKMIINSNSLPPTMDKTDGFYRRWLIIDFPNKFQEGVDVLSMISDEEIENLCGECLKLIPEIIKRGRFHNEGSIEDRRKKYEEKSNPIKSFIKENYVKNVNGEVPFFEFYDLFTQYVSERGLRVVNKRTLNRQLENEGFDIQKINKKIGDDWKSWNYITGLVPLVPVVPDISLSTLIRESKVKTQNDGNEWNESNLRFICKILEKRKERSLKTFEIDLEKMLILNHNMTKKNFIDSIEQLVREGVIIRPRNGEIQLI